ncbi:hypothetical protein [Rhizobium sp. S96]|uniref:hypothetical protein n=1 Tax=Rhizobium sp. S96 TaxID=3055140 RepID=UPI0025AA6CEE|nr:hypothetical protein [Rhizobium sp. S96]MDM9619062.1 hypothetical protein [Rhizobium sp. S96]
MATYFLSFRIADKTVNGKTYSERREAMINAVHSQGNGFWEGTTSFICLESPLSTWNIAAKASAPLSKNDDMLVIFDPSDMSMAHFGKIDHPAALESFFNVTKKL